MFPSERKILHLITLSEWGGAQQVCYDIVMDLKNKGWQVEVACSPGGPLVDRLRCQGVVVHTIESLRREISPLDDLKALFSIYRLTREEGYTVVHCHSTKAGFLGRLAAVLARNTVTLFTAHGWAFTEGRAYWQRWCLAQLERLVAKTTTRIICVSVYDRVIALHFQVGDPDKLIVVRNGVDPLPFLRVNRSARRWRVGLEEERALTFVGRLAPQKDPLTLLEAVRKLPKVKVLLVGGGPLRSEVERFVRHNGLANRVLLTGERTDIPNILAATDIFVLPSRWEGLPLAIIEAMMAGLPVVASGVGGVPELVEDGITGFLVPPGNPEALVSAIQKLLDDEELRHKMGQTGRQKALDHLTLARMLAETRKLYEDVFSGLAGNNYATST